MGLDVAELMIAVEEEFDVEIFEAEAQQVVTLNDLVDLIEKQISGSPMTEEQAQAFRAEGLRRAKEILSKKTGVDPATLSEDMRLETLFPLETRSELWKEIRKENEACRIPPLENPVPCYLVTIFFFETVTLPLVGILASHFANPGIVALFGVAFLIFSAVNLILYGIRHRRADFPGRCETVIGLARCLIADTIRLDSEGHAWTRPTIEKAVRTMMAETLGVEPEDIDLSARIDDLF